MNLTMTETLERNCVVCCKSISVILDEDGTVLSGGGYWGKVNLGEEDKVEYWECPECMEEE